MSTAIMTSSSSKVGLGRPSSVTTPNTLTTSLSLSSSLTASSSGASISPVAQARTEYSAAAHSFIQRRPWEALQQLDEARRLLFAVIPVEDDVRRSRTWTGLREKVLILWITLLVTLWKRDAEDHTLDDAQWPADLSSTTRDLLTSSTQPEIFLGKLLTEVVAQWAATTAEFRAVREETSLDFGEGGEAAVKREVLGALPASALASLIMASLSVEEGSLGRAPNSRQSDHIVSASAVPITRRLSEMMLASLTLRVDSADTSKDTERSLAAYARVLELYAVHVLGVRCGEWDYADQVVRLSLLQDEPRATLLMALARAHTHITTRPERRASAALAEQKAYEVEKQRRSDELKAKAQAAAAEADASPRSSPSDGSRSSRRPREKGVKRLQHEEGYLSASGAESSHASAGESDADVGTSSTRSWPRAFKAPTQERSTSPADGDRETTVPGVTGFAATRAQLSRTVARNRSRDQATPSVADSSTLDAETSSLTRHSSTSASASQQGSPIAAWQRILGGLKGRNTAVLLSVLGPLLVLFFSIRRLLGARRAGLGPARGGSPRVSGGEANDGLLRRAILRLWSTLRMGTQVTYL